MYFDVVSILMGGIALKLGGTIQPVERDVCRRVLEKTSLWKRQGRPTLITMIKHPF